MRALLCLPVFVLVGAPAFAQSNPCSGTPAWSPCDWSFDLNSGENPDTFELRAEFRSPTKHKTYLLHAYRDGDRRFTIRFAPTEEGDWDYRLSSNLSRLEGQSGKINAGGSASPGFIKTVNVHHFATADGKPHLWMATAVDGFLSMPSQELDRAIAKAAEEKFTHLRVTLPKDANLRDVFDRIRTINGHGLVADLVLASIPADAQARRKYITDIASRFAALNITWMGLPGFETVTNSRAILKDAGAILKEYDPYDHPRTSLADMSSGTFGNDPWASVLSYGTVDPNIGAVEHQLYGDPAINTGIRSSNDLWTATMNGQYPASGSGAYMTAWFNLMMAGRYWELEPYFDLDGGRGVALEGAEYIVYVEKPGPVEITLESHGYDVQWINPETGERTKSKSYRGEHYSGEPPDKSHAWVLYIYREGEIQSRKSYFFDSREIPIQIQQIEVNAEKTPYEVAAPPEGEVSSANPPKFSLRITRPGRGTRTLLVEWTGEITASGQGYRVIGSGREGTLQIPEALWRSSPASMLVRVFVLNANGKVYELDKVYGLRP
jgi:hypothetical protein